MKHTIEHDINDLEAIEMEYFDTVAHRAVAVQDFRDTQVALKKAARDAKNALKAEIDARKALEKAQERVGKTKQSVDGLTKAFAKIQAEEGKVTKQVETIAESMAKRQEKVRKALRRKELEVAEKRKRQAGEPVSYIKPQVEEEVPELVEEIDRLRKEERFLAAESDRQDEKIARILSRAAKLRARAEDGNPNSRAAP
jgi:peptidoglycan hydrolase CwlO-like protein